MRFYTGPFDLIRWFVCLFCCLIWLVRWRPTEKRKRKAEEEEEKQRKGEKRKRRTCSRKPKSAISASTPGKSALDSLQCHWSTGVLQGGRDQWRSGVSGLPT